MNRERQTRVTRKMAAIESSLVAATCCEPECGMTVLVDKEERAEGRAVRCTACTMRMKLRK